MSNANVSSEEIREQLNKLGNCIALIQDSIRKMYDQYKGLGTKWNDAKYQKLGVLVDQCIEELGKIRNEFYFAFEKLTSIYDAIQEYEGVELTGGNQTNFQTRLGQAASVVLNAGLLGLAGLNVIRSIEGENPQPLNNVDGLVTGADSVARWVDRSRFAQRVDQRIEEHRILHQIRHGDMVSDFGEQENPDHILIINSDD